MAGAVLFNTGTTTFVRFIERATGNIYEARSDSPEIKRLTNTTIPKLARVFWLPAGGALLAQTVSEDDLIETSYLKLKPAPKTATSSETSAPYQVTISRLPTGIQEISVNPDGKKIIYYTNERGSMWYTSNPDGTGKQNIYQNPITGWALQWYSGNSIFITTKASYSAPSYGYVMKNSGSQPMRVFGDVFGASARISPDGKKVLLSSGGDGSVLSVMDISSGSKKTIGAPTLSEKCAWEQAGSNYIVCGIPQKTTFDHIPDDWYQGKTATQDLIERINVEDDIIYIASDPKRDADTEIDVKEMYISKNGSYAAFLNKSDSSLWLLKITE